MILGVSIKFPQDQLNIFSTLLIVNRGASFQIPYLPRQIRQVVVYTGAVGGTFVFP